jgi:hypothetical protein
MCNFDHRILADVFNLNNKKNVRLSGYSDVEAHPVFFFIKTLNPVSNSVLNNFLLKISG